MLWYAYFQLILLLAAVVGSMKVKADDFSQPYFSDIVLPCQPRSYDVHINAPTSGRNTSNSSVSDVRTFVWLLPNGQTLTSKSSNNHDNRYRIRENNTTSNLTILKLEDTDYGVYSCIGIWNNFLVSVIRHSLNKDGAEMTAIREKQRKNAIVGACAAGSILLVILAAYVIWRFTCSERVRRKRRLTDDLAKGVNRFSTEFYDNVGFEQYMHKSDK